MPSNIDSWNDDIQYLNYPGLQYLFYKKIKPLFSQKKYKEDDLNWEIVLDYDTGNVYLTCSIDNQIFIFDDTGSCGNISDITGKIVVYVNPLMSKMQGGYIDDDGELKVSFNY